MSVFTQQKKAWVLLSDGSLFQGVSFGAEGTTIGEVVFATGLTGYQETLTDPSYYGQIVTQTFPLIGNYGVNDQDFESEKSWVKGYIVREWCGSPSNFRSQGDIDAFLNRFGIIGISDIDTRALTRKIRESGVMNGAITTLDPAEHREALLEQIRSYVITDAVKSVSDTEIRQYRADGAKRHVVLYDFGYKANIRKSLLSRGCDVTVVPYNTPAQAVQAMKPDGIMFSNGPGDPAENTEVIGIIRQLTGSRIPIFGICLGHQLMALASGGKTAKLKYGHRGANQPVIDLESSRTYVTTQNHGYEVLGDTLDPAVGKVSHINANDKSCEGVRYLNAPAFTVQFHPEATAGPLDTSFLFDRFVEVMDRHKAGEGFQPKTKKEGK